MVRFVTPDIGAKISGGQTWIGPILNGANPIQLEFTVKELQSHQAEVGVDRVDDGRLLGDHFCESPGRDDLCVDAHFATNPRDDRLRLTGEAENDSAL